VVRYVLIEMTWRLLRWQPDYPPINKPRSAMPSKRSKGRLVVAAARRLAIDLWRCEPAPKTWDLKIEPTIT